MATISSGVYPCYENQFQIDGKNIANCTDFSVSFDNNVDEWTPFETEGWTKRLMTGKSVTISVQAKRTIGDEGNDIVAGLIFANGTNAQKTFSWTFPDGTIVTFDNAVINVTVCGSGASTDTAPLEFEVQSNGKPSVETANG